MVSLGAHPATLMPRARKDLIECFPEAHCAVADRDFGRDRRALSLGVPEFRMKAL